MKQSILVISTIAMLCVLFALLILRGQPMLGVARGQKPPAYPGVRSYSTRIVFAPRAIIVAQDTFQRNDQVGWGTASDGHTWLGDAATSLPFSIVHRSGQIANAHGTYTALLGRKVDDVDEEVSGTVNHFVGDNTQVNFGLLARWIDNDNWYKVLIDGQKLVLLKDSEGQILQLMSLDFFAQDSVSYTLRLRVIGSILQAKVWSNTTREPLAWMLSVTDTTFQSGKSGVRMKVQNDTIVSLVSFRALATNL